MNRVDNQRKAI